MEDEQVETVVKPDELGTGKAGQLRSRRLRMVLSRVRGFLSCLTVICLLAPI
ncbi:MAG: hypothetical protein RIM23_17805 [Coleofasciculus sp. G3-WIS-01]|uniref:hypothetical protein n=1 Tax=Coleofasciculus sp. G3-WIS-01 TaxID=3069528 RepID=UPI0032FCAE52